MTTPKLFAPTLSGANNVSIAGILSATTFSGSGTASFPTLSSGSITVSSNLRVSGGFTSSNVSTTAIWSPVATISALTSSTATIGSAYVSNLTVLGTSTVINSITPISSNLQVVNLGTGPALYVSQNESVTAQPLASFVAGAANPSIYINSGGAVGVNTNSPQYTLHVLGNTYSSNVFSSNVTAIIGAIDNLSSSNVNVNTLLSASNVYSTGTANMNIVNANTATITNLFSTTHLNSGYHFTSNVSANNANFNKFLDCSNVVTSAIYVSGAVNASSVLIGGVAPLLTIPATAWSNVTATGNMGLSNVTASNVIIRGYSNVAPCSVFNWSSNFATFQVDKSGNVDISGALYVTGNVGVGSASPQAAIDVNAGTVRGNSYQMTNASGKKQFDSGSFTAQLNGTLVNFNFTFTNVPTVVCSVDTNPWNTGQTLAIVASPYSVTSSSCYINQVYWNTLATGAGQSSGYGAWQQCSGMTINWMAFG